jgi:hypothetical protein
MKTVDGKLYCVAGKSRSGKTAWTRQHSDRAKFDLVLAWDPEGQWGQLKGWRAFCSLKELALAVAKTKRGKFALVCDGDAARLKAQFDALCEYCFAVANSTDRPATMAFIGEELADVTTTAKAPAGWGKLLRRGLKRTLSIYALSQRWAEADKTALGNTSMIVCCSMMPPDVAYMATKTGIPADQLAALKVSETETHKHCPYIEYDVDSSEVKPGKMTFRK